MPLEREGERCTAEIDDQEGKIIEAGLAQGVAIELVLMLEQFECGDGELPNEREIHEWRQDSQRQLEQRDLRYGNHAQAAVGAV